MQHGKLAGADEIIVIGELIIVAIESGEDNKLVANPPMEYTIQTGDDLILSAQELRLPARRAVWQVR